MYDYRQPDQLRLITWTAVVIQLLHIAGVAILIARYNAQASEQSYAPALSATYVVVLCFPAVFLWGLYALLTHTSLTHSLSPKWKALLFVGLWLGVCGATFAALAAFATFYAVLHMPH